MPSRATLVRFVRAALPWLAIAIPCALVFGPGVYRHFASSFNLNRIADDTRIQLPYYYHYVDSELFRGDLLARYHGDGVGDVWRLLYILWAQFADPLTLSRLLPMPLYAVTLAAVAVAGNNVAGKPGAFVALALCLGASAMIGRLSGGLPRSFVCPLLCWLVACLTGGWIRGAAIITVIGAGLYPIVTVIGGICLAIVLLVMPAADRGSAASWSFKRRVAVLAITAGAAGALVAPFAIRVRPFGTTITPAMLAEFPEAGPGGRSNDIDCAPFPPFFEAAAAMATRSLFGTGDRLVSAVGKPLRKPGSGRAVFLTLLVLVSVFGVFRLGRVSAAVRRLAAFAAAIGIGYTLADAVTPALVVPERYTHYGMPALVPVALAGALFGLMPWRLLQPRDAPSARRRAAVWLVGVGGLLVAAVGSTGLPRQVLDVELSVGDQGLYRAVERLPKHAVVAGWPTGVMDQVPLVTKRIAFLTRQMHVPYHAKQTLMMRGRMRALIQAYFAIDPAPLLKLRDELGVTHLVVEWRYLRDKPPHYFRPFRVDIRRALRRAKGKSFELERQAATSKVFEDRNYTLLDLSRLRR